MKNYHKQFDLWNEDKKFINSAVVVPLTSTIKVDDPMLIPYDFYGTKKSAVVSQIRFIDSRRLRRKIALMDEADFNKIKTAIQNLFQ